MAARIKAFQEIQDRRKEATERPRPTRVTTRLCDVTDQGIRTSRGRRVDAAFAPPASRTSRDRSESIRGDNPPPVGSSNHGLSMLGGSWEEKEVVSRLPSRRNTSQACKPSPLDLATTASSDVMNQLRRHRSMEVVQSSDLGVNLPEVSQPPKVIRETRSEQIEQSAIATESDRGVFDELETMIEDVMKRPAKARGRDGSHASDSSNEETVLQHRPSLSHSVPSALRRGEGSPFPPARPRGRSLQKRTGARSTDEQSISRLPRIPSRDLVLQGHGSEASRSDYEDTATAPLSTPRPLQNITQQTKSPERSISKGIAERAAAFQESTSHDVQNVAEDVELHTNSESQPKRDSAKVALDTISSGHKYDAFNKPARVESQDEDQRTNAIGVSHHLDELGPSQRLDDSKQSPNQTRNSDARSGGQTDIRATDSPIRRTSRIWPFSWSPLSQHQIPSSHDNKSDIPAEAEHDRHSEHDLVHIDESKAEKQMHNQRIEKEDGKANMSQRSDGPPKQELPIQKHCHSGHPTTTDRYDIPLEKADDGDVNQQPSGFGKPGHPEPSLRTENNGREDLEAFDEQVYGQIHRSSDERVRHNLQQLEGSRVHDRIHKFEQAAASLASKAPLRGGKSLNRRMSRRNTQDGALEAESKAIEGKEIVARPGKAHSNSHTTATNRSQETTKVTQEAGEAGLHPWTPNHHPPSARNVAANSLGSPIRRGRTIERQFEQGNALSLDRGGSVSIHVEIGISRSSSRRRAPRARDVDSSEAYDVAEGGQVIVIKTDVVPEEAETSNGE